MAIKYYTDEHVSSAVVNGLRQRGVDVLTAKEAGMLGSPDEEHLKLANTQGRVIFAQDSDFLRFHSNGIEHHGIVYSHQRMPIGQIIQGLTLIYQILSEDDMKTM
jgi:hypothetical protein